MVTPTPTNRSSLMVAPESPIVSLLRIVMAQVLTVKPWLISAHTSTVRHWLMVEKRYSLVSKFSGSEPPFSLAFRALDATKYLGLGLT